MRRKIFAVIASLLFVCFIVTMNMVFSHKNNRYTTLQASKVIEKYQSQLESIVSYMISESPNGRYLDGVNSEDSYLCCTFIPQTVKESMETYFNEIAPLDIGSVYVLREDTLWYWHLVELSSDYNVVSFLLYAGTYDKDYETGNSMEESQMLYYSDMSLSQLQELLDGALINKYEVSLVKKNWFLVLQR